MYKQLKLGRVMVNRLVIDFWELVKVVLKRGLGNGEVGRGRDMKLLCFVALVSVWVYFCCYSGGCLCLRLQGLGVLYSWYSRLVSG
jgi:hypothetical protein